MLKLFQLILILSITGCGVIKKEEVPTDLRVTEVKLIGVKDGHRSEAIVVIKDEKKDFVFERSIDCRDWDIESKLRGNIGRVFKVYEIGNKIKPQYYKLGEIFCIGVYE